MYFVLIILGLSLSAAGIANLYFHIYPTYWIIERATELVGPLLGAVVVMWQINRQAKDTQRSQEDAAKYELQFKIHAEIRTAAWILSDAAVRFNSQLIDIIQQSKNRNMLIPQGIDNNIRIRPSDIVESHKCLGDAACNLTHLFESYRVVYPKSNLFQIAINTQLHNLTNEWVAALPKLIQILPFNQKDEEEFKVKKIPYLKKCIVR